ncbi:MAG: HAD family hydrolase [Deltaproteobacteria bacterium]|nr:HAD family hydrolase [Deltaproteobacteria bacterium]
MAKTAAFFDFDKTLLAADSASIGIRFLWDMGLLPVPFVAKALALNELYKRHLISEVQIGRRLLTFYRGKTIDPFEDGMCEFYENDIKPRLAPAILDRLRDHQEQGHVTVLVSGSLRYTLLPVKKDLGIDHLLCSDLEVDESGVLTGRPRGEMCVDKTKAVLARELAQAEGIDLSASYAYGNHQSDIPLLSLVGNPHAVEPTGPLRRHAQRHGWPILRFH